MNSLATLKTHISSLSVIGFDLDDTLWPNSEVIQRAIAAQMKVLQEALPRESVDAIEQRLARYIRRTRELFPEQSEDVVWLRKSVLNDLCEHFSIDHKWGDKAYNAFYTMRQSYQLFPGVAQGLTDLSKHFKLVAISNGNASLVNSGIGHLFEFHWIGGLNGRAKPNPDMLLKAHQELAISAEQFLYIGDHYLIDGAAAEKAGSHSIIVHAADAMPEYFQNCYGFSDLVTAIDWILENKKAS
ncbi:MAG: HAD family hydrolase [Kangiellaceae bacterium]|jgi:putative hydrolase of the HAD superfamily|nr:HAD family hydrolase [Kangiellaceae bacterium]